VCVECFDSHQASWVTRFYPISICNRTLSNGITETNGEKRQKSSDTKRDFNNKKRKNLNEFSDPNRKSGDNIDWIDVPRPDRYLNCAVQAMKIGKEEKRFGGKTDFRFKNAIHFPSPPSATSCTRFKITLPAETLIY
jgi:hypothetical protein